MDKTESIKTKFENMEMKSFAREVIEFIDEAPSTYHVVKLFDLFLEKNGFKGLALRKNGLWSQVENIF